MTKIHYNFSQPLVLERQPQNKKKKKKQKRVHLAKDLRHVETHLTRALRRTIRASDKGMRRYVALRETSAAREKDGVVVDFVPNVVESTAVVMRHFTLVPIDVLRASYTPSMRRLLRTSLRA